MGMIGVGKYVSAKSMWSGGKLRDYPGVLVKVDGLVKNQGCVMWTIPARIE